MKYFSLTELTASSVATARGLNNTPSPQVRAALTALVEHVLDPVRAKWGRPITVNSGYRSAEVNRAVKGAATSQHLRGEAADITAGSPTLNGELYALICSLAASGAIEFDQLIDEKNFSWIHISYRVGGGNRHQKLKL